MRRWWHLTDGEAVCLAAALVSGMCLGAVPAATLTAAAAVVTRGRPGVIVGATLVAFVGAALWTRAWTATASGVRGEYTGWVEVVADPQRLGRGMRLTVEIDGRRYDAWAFGGARRRVERIHQGDRVWITGERRALSGNVRRARLRHVVGRLDVGAIGDVRAGSGLDRSATRIRRLLADAADRTMGGDDAALFTGLVVGDDSRQSAVMIEQFRRSGLSHLTAVSGQNITLLLALAGPALRRLRPVARLATTVGLVAWLVVVTRAEPSVLRAGAMAALGAVAFATGRPTSPIRILAIATAVLLVADPLLSRSVGLWLSVGATAGVVLVAPLIGEILPGPVWLRLALSVSLAAQLGVAVPSLMVFGRLPVSGVITNLLAVPVAGAVMTLGVPCAVASAVVGSVFGGVAPWADTVAMAAPAAGTRWVRHVAELGAAIEPPPVVAVTAWGLLTVWLGARWFMNPCHAGPGEHPPGHR